jgi:transcriptional regulator with XRE-family HTH domain
MGITGKRYFRFDGDKLASRRRQKGLTQEKLAEILGMDVRSVQSWEAGGQVFHTRIEKLKAALGEVESLDATRINPDREHVFQCAEKFLDPWLKKRYKGLPPIALSLKPLHPTSAPNKIYVPGAKFSSIVAAFQDIVQPLNPAGRSMLITGDAGTGKSVLLLDLLDHLLVKTRRSSNGPFVLWLDLNRDDDLNRTDVVSCRMKHLSFNEWILQQLRQCYKVDPETARRWLEREKILRLLLDGFDDLESHQRENCLDSIADFLGKPDCTHAVVICGRSTETEVLTAHFPHGIVIPRLRPPDVRRYLKGNPNNEKLAALSGVRADKMLYELLDTPFKIHVAAEAFSKHSVEIGLLGVTEEERDAKLLHLYMDTLLIGLDPDAALRWLSWLTKILEMKVTDHKLRLESMQPDWLPTKVEQRAVTIGAVVLSGLLVGTTFGLGAQFAMHWKAGLVMGLAFGLGGGTLFGVLQYGHEIRLMDTFRLNWWSRAKRRPLYLVFGSGLFGMVFGVFSSLAGGTRFGFGVGALTGLLFLFLYPMADDAVPKPPIPNWGIWRALRHAVMSGLIGGLIVGMIFGGIFGLGSGIITGATLGLVLGLFNGGHTCLQHLLLRILLAYRGATPWRYVQFLNRTVGLDLMEKRGGTYEFRHDLIKRFFSELQPRMNRGGVLIHPLVESEWYSRYVKS